jgi:hypothetical protein
MKIRIKIIISFYSSEEISGMICRHIQREGHMINNMFQHYGSIYHLRERAYKHNEKVDSLS